MTTDNIFDFLADWLTQREASGKSRTQHTINALNKALPQQFPNNQYHAIKTHDKKLLIREGNPKQYQLNTTIISIYGYFNDVAIEDVVKRIMIEDCSDYRQRENDEETLDAQLQEIETQIMDLRLSAIRLIENLPLPVSRMRQGKNYWNRPSSRTQSKYPYCFNRVDSY